MFKKLNALVLTLMIGSLLPVSKSWAQDAPQTLACAHVQVCNLVEEFLSPGQAQELKVQMPFQVQGDPHHFEPGPQEVKQLLEAAFLVAPSYHLSGWLKKIIQQRKQNKNLKTYELKLAQNSKLSEKFSRETLAHFWLHPDSLCQAKKEVGQQLKSWGLLEQLPKISCRFLGITILAKKLKKHSQKTPLVLYHDALMPYLYDLGVEAKELKGSGHAEQVSISKLKSFHQYLGKHPNVLWVRESSIHIHSQFKGLQRENDLSVQVDTLGSRHQTSSQVLVNVLKKILYQLPIQKERQP